MSLPWWAKIAAKLVLARVPISRHVWRRVNLFRHGQMDDTNYAEHIFIQHYNRVKLPAGWVGLELGPGDSILSAVLASHFGAAKFYLVDAGDFASPDMTAAKALAKKLGSPDLSGCTTRNEVLAACNAEYITTGVAGLKTIPPASVDFVFSNAVLEHVRVHEFAETLAEFHRLTKPSGTQSHAIDLRDHLQNALNNLRFSSRLWESPLMANSGFYTNRLRHSEIMAALNKAGFKINEVARTNWPQLPTARTAFHPDFQGYTEAELCISTFDVVLTPLSKSHE
jgi:SAM-dependent methyltransferase